MPNRRSGPTTVVLNAFGVADTEVEPLSGGEETSVVTGGLVLKQVMDPALAAWTQGLLADADLDDVRVATPVRSAGGAWVVDGWTAHRFVPGLTSMADDPAAVIYAGRQLAVALSDTRAADAAPVHQRVDRWALADRYAWAEIDLELSPEAQSVAAAIRPRAMTPDEPNLVVHGDLTGNVFADPDGAPVILDVTPYLRPVGYASAIVVADHLLWRSGRPELADLVDEGHLARALLFRLGAEQLAEQPRHGADLDHHRRALALLGWPSSG